ncbi:MAG: antitoxin [Angustibacter sp.]
MVTEEQIERWAVEAEAGYDVEESQRRGRGRPGRGAEPMQVSPYSSPSRRSRRWTRDHVSRSEAIRRALADFMA